MENQPYENQMRVRMESLFGVADFYSSNLRTLGHEAWDKPIHLPFIDGSHQYEDALVDFYGFLPYVVADGIVALRDVVETWPGPLESWNGVIRHCLENIGACSTLAYGSKPR